MKLTLASLTILSVLLLAIPAFAADLQEITLPKVADPAQSASTTEAPAPGVFRLSPEGVLLAVDVGELKSMLEAKAQASTWTGVHPFMWWTNNIQPLVFVKRHPVATLSSLALGTGAVLVGENNDWFQGDGSSKSSSSTATASDLAIPTVAGDAIVLGITGVGNNVSIVNRPYAVGAAAAAE